MKKILNDLIDSLNTKDTGYSARKLSAFAGVVTAITITIKNCDGSNINIVLAIWLMFALLCMGLITFADILKFKNGQTIVESTTVATATSETVTKVV